MIDDADLEAHRDAMTLPQRVRARRELDARAGITYPPPDETRAAELARVIRP